MTDEDAVGSRSSRLAGARETEDQPFSEELRRMVADLVLQTAPEGIWLIDAEARTTFVNRRFADLLGYTPEEMIGKQVFSFLARERWPVAEKNLAARAQGEEARQEVELVRKDGTRVWVLGSANPVFDRNGDYGGALAFIGDLTPQKEREQVLHARIETLQSRLASQQPPAVPPAAPAPDRRPPAPEPRGYREPFRTVIVVATFATLFATIAVVTAGAVVSSLLTGPAETG